MAARSFQLGDLLSDFFKQQKYGQITNISELTSVQGIGI